MPLPSDPMRQATAHDMRIEAVGDRCVLVRLGQDVDVETSRRVHAVTALLSTPMLPGVVEVVPAFNTVAVHFQPSLFARQAGLPSTQLTRLLEERLAQDLPVLASEGRVVEIPACYGGAFGPDLEEVAQQCGLSVEDTIALHSASTMTLYAFFFSPGNPFAGPLDARLHVGRRSSPRTHVEAGSVAIANGITSIYQTASPGGWNVIARTPWNLFDHRQQPPTRLRLGDRLRFIPIAPEQFRALLEPRS